MENAYEFRRRRATKRCWCCLGTDDDPVGTLKANEVHKAAKNKGKSSEKRNRGKENGWTAPPKKTVTTAAPKSVRVIKDSNKAGRKSKKSNVKLNNVKVKTERGVKQENRSNRAQRTDRPPVDKDSVVKIEKDCEEIYILRNRVVRRPHSNRDRQGGNVNASGDFGRGNSRRGGDREGIRRSRGRPGDPPGDRGGERPCGSASGISKRECDRQSGSDKSGVKPVDKRDGAGSLNWGTYKDDMNGGNTTGEAPTEDFPDENQENIETEEQGEVNAGDKQTESDTNEPKHKKSKRVTFNTRQLDAKPVFNLRKAGEDQTQWPKSILKKKEKLEFVWFSGDEEEEDEEYDRGDRGESPDCGERPQLVGGDRAGDCGGDRSGERDWGEPPERDGDYWLSEDFLWCP